MNELGNHIEIRDPAPRLPMIAIIEHCMLTRTCIASILKPEFPEYGIGEMTTTKELVPAAGSDVRVIVLGIGNKPIADPAVEDDFATLARGFRHVPIVVLCNRDDEAPAAMQRGVRGFFPTSISVEVAIAGLRLVLAGGAYCPLSLDARPADLAGFEKADSMFGPHALPGERYDTQGATVELTPREKLVFAELELGLPNKMIAARLNLSENTVKMHIQHIMRKCSARNRTEAVLFCSGRLMHSNGHVRTRMSSSS